MSTFNLGSLMVYVGADTSALATAEAKIKGFTDRATTLLKGLDATVKINTQALGAAQTQISSFSNKATADLKNISAGIKIDTTKLADASSKLASFNSQAQRDLKNTAKAANGVESAFNSVKNAILGYLTFQGALGIIHLADEFQILQQRIKTASDGIIDFTYVSKNLQAISIGTGTELKNNVAIFQAMMRSAKDLGSTVNENLKVTRSLGQLGIMGGSTTTQMEDSLLQFSQALSLGRLRAQEFNSIVQNTPEIANRIAQGLGVSSGHLKVMVDQGKVLSGDVFDAILKQSNQIDEQFKKIPTTFSREMVAAKTEFQGFLDDLNKYNDKGDTLTGKLGQGVHGVATAVREQPPLKALQIDVMTTQISRAWTYIAGESKLGFMKVGLYFLQFLNTGIQGFLNIGYTALEFLTEKMIAVIKLIPGMGEAAKNAEKDLERSRTSRKALGFDTKPLEEAIKTERGLLDKSEDEKSKAAQAAWDKYNSIYQKGEEVTNQLTLKGIGDKVLGQKAEAAITNEESSKNTEAVMREYAKQKALDDQDANRVRGLFSDKQKTQLEYLQGEQIILQKGLDNARINKEDKLKIEVESIKVTTKIQEEAAKGSEQIQLLSAITGIDIQKKTQDDSLNAQAEGFGQLMTSALSNEKDAFNLKKSITIANILLDTPKAVSGAYAVGSSLGGPILGAVFGATAAVAEGALLGQAIASNFSGREFGGPVAAGGTYRVNENGPEMLSVGDKNFLMMGTSGGSVTPMSNSDGGSGRVHVNIQNAPGMTAEVNQTRNGGDTDINVIIKKVDEAMAAGIQRGNSLTSRSMQNTYGVSRGARAN